MKASLYLLFFFFMLPVAMWAQSDEIPTSKGPLKIHPVEHASMVWYWDDKTIYIDPAGYEDHYEKFKKPDIIVITDIHGDHMDKKTLATLDGSQVIYIVPPAVADSLKKISKGKFIVMRNGDNFTQSEINITAIPMYNLPESPKERHVKGRGNGYVMNLGGKNIYISGDTEDIPEMRALKNIDVAFMCMNMPYTMDVNQAASAVLEFQPRIVYPYHYKGQDVEDFKHLVNAVNPNIEVRLRNWYPY